MCILSVLMFGIIAPNKNDLYWGLSKNGAQFPDDYFQMHCFEKDFFYLTSKFTEFCSYGPVVNGSALDQEMAYHVFVAMLSQCWLRCLRAYMNVVTRPWWIQIRVITIRFEYKQSSITTWYQSNNTVLHGKQTSGSHVVSGWLRVSVSYIDGLYHLQHTSVTKSCSMLPLYVHTKACLPLQIWMILFPRTILC